jgi:hypothetical protein
VSGIGVVVALAVAVSFLAFQSDEDPPLVTTSTRATIGSTTSTTVSSSISQHPATTTSTTTAAQRQAEVEELLQNLWFGWFDAIYRKDADALWEVVATTRSHESGVDAMESMEFFDVPALSQILIPDQEILLDRPDCLVVFYSLDVSGFRGSGAITDTVSVLWPDERYGFRMATGWRHKNDLWQMDCDTLEREVTP